jgi:hypothetical protein
MSISASTPFKLRSLWVFQPSRKISGIVHRWNDKVYFRTPFGPLIDAFRYTLETRYTKAPQPVVKDRNKMTRKGTESDTEWDRIAKIRRKQDEGDAERDTLWNLIYLTKTLDEIVDSTNEPVDNDTGRDKVKEDVDYDLQRSLKRLAKRLNRIRYPDEEPLRIPQLPKLVSLDIEASLRYKQTAPTSSGLIEQAVPKRVRIGEPQSVGYDLDEIDRSHVNLQESLNSCCKMFSALKSENLEKILYQIELRKVQSLNHIVHKSVYRTFFFFYNTTTIFFKNE